MWLWIVLLQKTCVTSLFICSVGRHTSFHSNKVADRLSRRGMYDCPRTTDGPAFLANKFTELYKMEWKSAHEVLAHILGDKQAIRYLLWIIAVCVCSWLYFTLVLYILYIVNKHIYYNNIPCFISF